jgi:Protein of unknown function (DUF2853)
MIRKDYKQNLEKYTNKPNEAALGAIIKYCGIALRGLDSQYVSMTDEAEVKRVTVGFAAKKLGLTAAEAKTGLKAVDAKMKEEKSKMRTTVYYLLAENTKTLSKLK